MTKKIRVLQTIRQGKIGGGERHVIDLVESMDKSVFEPIVLSFTDGEMIDYLKSKGIETHVIYTERGFDYRVWGQVTAFAKEKHIDIIHAHGTRACSNSFRSAKKLGIPCLYTVHGWSFHDDQPFVQKNIRKFLEGVLIKQVDRTILVSENNEKEAVSMFSPRSHSLVKNGVNLTRFSLDITSSVREELGLSEDCFVVGYIARMTKQKDPLSMVRAMGVVNQSVSNIKLLMVGSGEMDDEVETLIHELGLNSCIVRVPFRTDVPQVLKAVDVYCLPSLWEGLPIGVLEAMAMAKPIIATKIGGTLELVVNGENGYLNPVKSPELLAENIVKIHEMNKDKQQEMGMCSRRVIEKTYSIEVMTRQIEQIYLSYID